jgi:hypothetical protein
LCVRNNHVFAIEVAASQWNLPNKQNIAKNQKSASV